MAEPEIRDIAALRVERVGRVVETGDPLRPYALLDEHGVEAAAVSEFLHHMLADDARPTSLRSYAFELLSWFRPAGCRGGMGYHGPGRSPGFRSVAEDRSQAVSASSA